uniref:Uncharacterized protein n=1 Tax=Oryza nivara TaxID=4536 RepID=A0A0E0HU64_ORYNI
MAWIDGSNLGPSVCGEGGDEDGCGGGGIGTPRSTGATPFLPAVTLRLGMLPPLGGGAAAAASSVVGGFGIRWVVGWGGVRCGDRAEPTLRSEPPPRRWMDDS